MRWSTCIASIALFASAPARSQPADPAQSVVLTWETDKLVLTSPSSPDAVCNAAVIPEQTNRYTFTPSTDCLDKLGIDKLGIVTHELSVKTDGTYWDGAAQVKPKAMFNPAGNKVEPQKVRDQGPFLVVIDDKTFVQTKELKPIPNAAPPRRCTFSEAHEGDVAIDLATRSVRKNPARNVIGPNEGLTVYVCPVPTQPVNVTWGGTRGLTIAQIPSEQHAGGPSPADPSLAAERQTAEAIRFTFPPRQAGPADLKLFDTNDLDGKPAMTFPLEVEPRYWGAVRFGLGTLFGRWKSYDVGTFAGSRQPQVRETSEGAAFELVSGFAPYVFDLGSGGRSQTGGPNKHLAPFLGFGVLGVAPDKGIQGLSSFHAGLEYEVANNFSIAATFVYHRSRQLAMGYTAGAPVAVGMTVDNVTTDSWERGFAIVVNASPSFLQFATGDSSKSGAKQ